MLTCKSSISLAIAPNMSRSVTNTVFCKWERDTFSLEGILLLFNGNPYDHYCTNEKNNSHFDNGPLPKSKINSYVHVVTFSYKLVTPEAAVYHVFWNRCSLKFCNIHRKTHKLESPCNKIVDLKTCNFIKRRLQHRCSSMDIAILWRIAFFGGENFSVK